MKFVPTSLAGAWLIELERHTDARGAFARTFCNAELAERGLDARVDQCSVSFNTLARTLRGIHFQASPAMEAKLVRVQRGEIWDVIVDLRRDSRTFSRWYGAWLSADNGSALFVPEGFGHGFITLQDRTEVFYQISVPYQPELARGIRWDDEDLGILWPVAPVVVGEKDRALPRLRDAVL